MFSKVYKQKFFSSPAKDKKVQVFENTRLFRKLAFKGSPRNRIIQRHVLKGGNAMAGITGPGKGIPGNTQGQAPYPRLNPAYLPYCITTGQK
jgi:hypothetical protein